MIIIETPNFTIHAIDGYIETLYLVVYSDKLLLLDGGCRCDAKDVVDYIQRLYWTDGRIKTGSSSPTLTPIIPEPLQLFIIDMVWRSQPCQPSTSGTLGINGWFTQKTDIFLTYYVAQKKGKQFKHLRFPRRTPITHPLSNGMHLPISIDWQTLSTPGHTKMDASIYHKKESIAYVADLLIGLGKRYSTPYPISDPRQYRENLFK